MRAALARDILNVMNRRPRPMTPTPEWIAPTTKAGLLTMVDMVNRQLLTAITAINPDMAHPEKRASIELCWAYGGVRIVRASTQKSLSPRGTKREAYNRLSAMSEALDIVAGY